MSALAPVCAQGDPIDLAALRALIAQLQQLPAKDADGLAPRTVVSLDWLERVEAELSAGRSAAEVLGRTFGGVTL